jgi:hypothetical protein
MATDLFAVASGRPSNVSQRVLYLYVMHHDIPPCSEKSSDEDDGAERMK